MTTYQKTKEIQEKLVRRGLPFDTDFFAVNQLRRIERQLHRWCELECGDSNDYSSWCISRDDETDLPYMEVHPHKGETRRYRVADREKGALKRLAKICQEKGVFYQTDCRGCALYVSSEPLTDSNYTQGVAIC